MSFTTNQVSKLSYSDFKKIAHTDRSYLTDNPSLRQFFKYDVSLDSFSEVISAREKFNTDRSLLVKMFESGYVDVDATEQVKKNIELLSDQKTFTITTAHQPCLLTGPLYFIYKIASVINLCAQLKEKYPAYQFVPVFMLGSEDHDLDEIRHVHLFNKTISYVHEGTPPPVGRLNTSEMAAFVEEYLQIIGESAYAAELAHITKNAFEENITYNTSIIRLLNGLFGDDGLLVLNPDQKAGKEAFKEIIKDDLTQNTSYKLVSETQAKLNENGFKSQAYVREINLFYMTDSSRDRIVYENDMFQVLNSEKRFTLPEILEEADLHPDRFSPNVILRPLYQELLLPNLAYIGGGGELAYWLERKNQFDAYHIPYPMLIRRNSIQWMDKASAQKLQKFGFDSSAIFEKPEDLQNAYIKNNSGIELSLNEEIAEINKVVDGILEKSNTIDATLAGAVNAERAKIVNMIHGLEAKVVKAQKNKFQTALQQIAGIVQKQMPGGDLQERYENFTPFYLKYGKEWIAYIISLADPMDKRFILVEEK